MISSGMKNAGYQYVIIDDCRHGERDPNGDIQPDAKRFPEGIKELAAYVHGCGLRLGIYSDAGAKTCGGRPGSRGYEYQDAKQYAAWGVDYLEYDWCNTGTENAETAYPVGVMNILDSNAELYPFAGPKLTRPTRESMSLTQIFKRMLC
jgi:alpha-galactosidase